MIWVFNQSTDNDIVPPKTVEEKQESTLQENYDKHKNFLWYICQEWMKFIDWWPYNFEWPTYAWEYMKKFIIKWTNNWKLFRCEFVPYDNERGMNLVDARYE